MGGESVIVNWSEVEVCFWGWWEGKAYLWKKRPFQWNSQWLYFQIFLSHLLQYRDWCWGEVVSLALHSGLVFRQVYFDMFFKSCLCFISFICEMGNRLSTLLLLLGLLALTAWIWKCCRHRSQSTRLSARLLKWKETGSWNWSLCCRKGSGWFYQYPLWDAAIKEILRRVRVYSMQYSTPYAASVILSLNRGFLNFYCSISLPSWWFIFFIILLEQRTGKMESL